MLVKRIVQIPNYLSDYLKALFRGLWSGFERTDTIVIVLIVLVFGLGWFGINGLQEHPPAWLVSTLAAVFVFYESHRSVYQLYARERAEREAQQRHRLPALVPQEPNIASAWRLFDPHKPQLPVRYVRLQVRNAGGDTVSDCSAKLTKIELADGNDFQALRYNDTLDLAWSNKPKGSERIVDLYNNNSDTFDVVYTVQDNNELKIASVVPANYPGLMTIPGLYQFTIKVSGRDTPSRTVKLRLHWGLSLERLTFPAECMDYE